MNCTGHTRTGAPCARRANPGDDVCWQHKREGAEVEAVAGDAVCTAVKRDGVRCGRHAVVNGLCRLHDNMGRRPRRAELLDDGLGRFAEGTPYAEIIDQWWRDWWQRGTLNYTTYMWLRRRFMDNTRVGFIRDPPWFDREHVVYDLALGTTPIAGHILDDMLGQDKTDQILELIEHNPLSVENIFAIQQAVIEGVYDPPDPPPAPVNVWRPQALDPRPAVPHDPNNNLAHFVADAQNIHTTVVSEQLNRGMEKLLAQDVPDSRDALVELRANDPDWVAGILHLSLSDARKVVADVRSWYKKRLCRTAGDFLYRKCLNGLLTLIQASPHKDDLVSRFWEEAYDATGMCCEGHLARLTNVLVGFDEDIPAPVAVGEILQQKIAAIAALDVRVEEKVGQAWVVFLELNIPMEERMAWLDAL